MNTVIVTGAAGGIGEATLAELAHSETRIVCVDRDRTRLEAVIEKLSGLPGERLPVVSPLASQRDCAAIFETVGGAVNGLVHLAGLFEKDPDLDPDVFARAIQHNLTNAYLLAGQAANQMADDGSASMVFVSSLAFMRGSKDYVAYSAAKGGLVGMARALSRRLAPRVRVNVITPGVIDTPMPADIIRERGQSLYDEIPLGRIGKPVEIATVVRFLLSPDSSFITGQIINPDGGVVNS